MNTYKHWKPNGDTLSQEPDRQRHKHFTSSSHHRTSVIRTAGRDREDTKHRSSRAHVSDGPLLSSSTPAPTYPSGAQSSATASKAPHNAPHIRHRKRRIQSLPYRRKLILQLKDTGKPLLIPGPHLIGSSPLWIKPPSCLQIRFVMPRIIIRILATVLATPPLRLPKAQSPKPLLLGLAHHRFLKK
jgi:hypothetical protein